MRRIHNIILLNGTHQHTAEGYLGLRRTKYGKRTKFCGLTPDDHRLLVKLFRMPDVPEAQLDTLAERAGLRELGLHIEHQIPGQPLHIERRFTACP